MVSELLGGKGKLAHQFLQRCLYMHIASMKSINQIEYNWLWWSIPFLLINLFLLITHHLVNYHGLMKLGLKYSIYPT